MTERAELEAVIEAVLFVSSDPVSRTRLLELFDEDDRTEAAAALAAVVERYAPAAGRGIQAEEVAGGVRLVTRPDLHGWLRRFFEVASAGKLSMAALETLAIVAYRQPVTAPEIQELRTVNPAGVLKTLLERRLVRIAGRKEVVGKPFLYCTTREFLVHFGLKNLKDLPPLEELEEALEGEDGGPGSGGDREEAILRSAAALDEAGDPEGDDEADEPIDDLRSAEDDAGPYDEARSDEDFGEPEALAGVAAHHPERLR